MNTPVKCLCLFRRAALRIAFFARTISATNNLFLINRNRILSPLPRVLLYPSHRWYNKPVDPAEIERKTLDVCTTFDKIDPKLLTLDSDFRKDLGLSSLDHIDLIMEMENEFQLVIDDVLAEKLLTPRDIIKHVIERYLQAHEVV